MRQSQVRVKKVRVKEVPSVVNYFNSLINGGCYGIMNAWRCCSSGRGYYGSGRGHNNGCSGHGFYNVLFTQFRNFIPWLELCGVTQLNNITRLKNFQSERTNMLSFIDDLNQIHWLKISNKTRIDCVVNCVHLWFTIFNFILWHFITLTSFFTCIIFMPFFTPKFSYSINFKILFFMPGWCKKMQVTVVKTAIFYVKKRGHCITLKA